MVLEGLGRPPWVHWLQRPAVLQRPLPRLPLRHHKQPLVIACESVLISASIALPVFPVCVLKSTVFIAFWLTYSRNKKKKCGDSSFCLKGRERTERKRGGRGPSVALKERSGNMWKGVQTTQPVVTPIVIRYRRRVKGPLCSINQQKVITGIRAKVKQTSRRKESHLPHR